MVTTGLPLSSLTTLIILPRKTALETHRCWHRELFFCYLQMEGTPPLSGSTELCASEQPTSLQLPPCDRQPLLNTRKETQRTVFADRSLVWRVVFKYRYLYVCEMCILNSAISKNSEFGSVMNSVWSIYSQRSYTLTVLLIYGTDRSHRYHTNWPSKTLLRHALPSGWCSPSRFPFLPDTQV